MAQAVNEPEATDDIDEKSLQQAKKVEITEKDLKEALKLFGKSVPEFEKYFDKYGNDIIKIIQTKSKADENSNLYKEGKAIQEKGITDDIQLGASKVSLGKEALDVLFDKCTIACGTLLVQIVLFCLSVAGLRVKWNEKMTRALLRGLGEDTVLGFKKLIHDLMQSAQKKKWTDCCKTIFSIIGGLYTAGGVGIIIKEVMKAMNWWDWVTTGTLAVAQLIAWIATEGLAFVAEAVLTIGSAVYLIEAIDNVYEQCFKDGDVVGKEFVVRGTWHFDLENGKETANGEFWYEVDTSTQSYIHGDHQHPDGTVSKISFAGDADIPNIIGNKYVTRTKNNYVITWQIVSHSGNDIKIKILSKALKKE